MGTTSNYSYDALYQLQQVTQGNVTSESYSYDAVGNRLTSSGVAAYNYNPSNQLTSTSNATYLYDYNGNTLTKADTTGTTQYTWDFENRLTSVTLPDTGNGPTVVTFKYDPFGRRIQKSSPNGTTNYLYDGTNLLEEIDQSGNVLARYTQTTVIDEPLSMLRSGTTSYYQSDALGSSTSLSNAAGALANTYSYDAFGKLTASTGTLINPFQYTAREFDPETGTYYYRMRYYDQGTGRFLSEDPIRFKGGSNFYDYVRNNPMDLVDSMGLFAEVICEPVQQYHLGFLIGARHCRLRVNCGHQVPDRTYELNGRSSTQPLTKDNYDPSRPGYRLPVSKPCNQGHCQFEECLVNRFNFYWDHPNDLPTYDPINANSNAFVRELVRSCGGDVQFNEFHYNNPLSWYNFYGQMPD